MKTFLYVFFSCVLSAMLWVTVTASLDRSVLVAASEIWDDPWGKATLFDAYFAFLTVFLWIAYRETSWLRRGLWLVLLLTLGNFAIAAYFLLALRALPPSTPWTGLFEAPGAPRRLNRWFPLWLRWAPDVQTSNGVLHIIDTVLIPEG